MKQVLNHLYTNEVGTLIIGLFASVLTVLLILPLGGFLKKLHNDTHNLTAAPRLGGIACILGVVEFLLLLSDQLSHKIIACILFASVMAITGTIDDLWFKIKAEIKLFVSILIGSLFCFYQLSVAENLAPFDPTLGIHMFILFLMMTVWVSLTTQAFNVIDGANGLLAVNFIAPFTVIIYFLNSTTDFYDVHAAMFFVGFSVGMLAFNIFFKKFYHGDGGAYFLGAILATSGLILVLHSETVVWGVIPVLAFLPIYELLRSAVRRLVTFRGIFTPDNEHLHSYILQRARKEGTQLGYLKPCIILSVFPISSSLTVFYFSKSTLVLGCASLFLVILYELLIFSFKRVN